MKWKERVEKMKMDEKGATEGGHIPRYFQQKEDFCCGFLNCIFITVQVI